MSDEIPLVNCGAPKVQPVAFQKKEGDRYVLVITNDSTVFTTKRWVSAEEMFGGRLTEVKNLVQSLTEISNVSFGIISGKYGFIPANYVIMPYDNVPECKEDYEELQERTDYAEKIRYVCQNFFDRIIVCVPKDMFAMFVEADQIDDGKLIAVTNPCFKDVCEKKGWTFLERKGARVGNENADEIERLIRELCA